MGILKERNTNETQITIDVDFSGKTHVEIDTGVPFFDHMLTAMAFHGGMSCSIKARGDIDVDPHHLVEDVGLVLGSCLAQFAEERGPLHRFGHSVVPMDDALAEVTIDLCGRPYLEYRAVLPQPRVGSFDVSLTREFLHGLATNGRLNLHAECRYGENSHHMVESLFKALGRALHEACAPFAGTVRSTKGHIETSTS